MMKRTTDELTQLADSSLAEALNWLTAARDQEEKDAQLLGAIGDAASKKRCQLIARHIGLVQMQINQAREML